MLSSLLQVAIASLIDFCFNVLFGQGQVYMVWRWRESPSSASICLLKNCKLKITRGNRISSEIAFPPHS